MSAFFKKEMLSVFLISSFSLSCTFERTLTPRVNIPASEQYHLGEQTTACFHINISENSGISIAFNDWNGISISYTKILNADPVLISNDGSIGGIYLFKKTDNQHITVFASTRHAANFTFSYIVPELSCTAFAVSTIPNHVLYSDGNICFSNLNANVEIISLKAEIDKQNFLKVFSGRGLKRNYTNNIHHNFEQVRGYPWFFSYTGKKNLRIRVRSSINGTEGFQNLHLRGEDDVLKKAIYIEPPPTETPKPSPNVTMEDRSGETSFWVAVLYVYLFLATLLGVIILIVSCAIPYRLYRTGANCRFLYLLCIPEFNQIHEFYDENSELISNWLCCGNANPPIYLEILMWILGVIFIVPVEIIVLIKMSKPLDYKEIQFSVDMSAEPELAEIIVKTAGEGYDLTGLNETNDVVQASSVTRIPAPKPNFVTLDDSKSMDDHPSVETELI